MGLLGQGQRAASVVGVLVCAQNLRTLARKNRTDIALYATVSR
jgi:hypothetical protein